MGQSAPDDWAIQKYLESDLSYVTGSAVYYTRWSVLDNETDLYYNTYQTVAGGLLIQQRNTGLSVLDTVTAETGTTTAHYGLVVASSSFPPTGLTATSITISTIGIEWVNNETTYITGNTVQVYSGGTWNDIADVGSTDTTYTLTGLTWNTTYTIRVAVRYNGYFPSTSISPTTLDATPIAPTSVTQTAADFTTIDISWTNNEDYGKGDFNSAQINNGGWQNTAVSLAATTHQFTGLTANNTYSIRVALVDTGSTYYYSSAIDGDTQEILAPSNLAIASKGLTYIGLTWQNNSASEGVKVYYKKTVDVSWIEWGDVASGSTSSTITGLDSQTQYSFKVASYYNPEFDSGVVSETTNTFPSPFCAAANYTITNSTCGNSDGSINITNPDYLELYDFVLTDIDNVVVTLTGLTAGFYFLTVTVKSEYSQLYSGDACNFEWIEIIDSDSPMVLDSVSVRPAQCQSFDVVSGRIYYDVSGLDTGHTYSFNVWDADKNLMASQTGLTTTEEFLLDNVSAGCYYTIITDEISGCHLIVDAKCVTALSQLSQGGLKKCWIAPWTDYLDYNYWTSTDDDFFLEFEDTSFFFSTKIKEYLLTTGGSIQWYSLPIAPQVAKLSQKLNKVPQGFIFEDTLDIAIAKGNASKWTAMATILNPENKWLWIVLDADGNYWTGGYRHGARISAYNFKSGARSEDNGYLLTFSAQSENKIMTNIDSNYVKNNVI